MKLFWGSVKAVFIIAGLLGVTLFMLARIGGQSEPLKIAIEDFISESSGLQARIGEFGGFYIFPNIAVEFGDVSFTQPGAQTPVARIGKASVGMGFFDVVFGAGRLKALDIQNVQVDAGVVTRDALLIDTLGIQDDVADASSAALVVHGLLGEMPLKASAALHAAGEGVKRVYSLHDAHRLNVMAGDIGVQMRVDATSFDQADIQDLVISYAGDVFVKGALTLKSALGGGHNVTGDVMLGQGTQVKPDVKISVGGVKGDVLMPTAHIEDLAAVAGFAGRVAELLPRKDAKPADDRIDFSGPNIDLRAVIEALHLHDTAIGAQTLTVSMDKNALSVQALEGTLAGGATVLDVSFVPVAGEAGHIFKLTSRMDDVNIGALFKTDSKAVLPLDFSADVSAQAASWRALKAGFNGRIRAVSEDGRLASRWLNVWGDGLASLVIPSVKPSEDARVKCAVIDAPVQGGVFDFASLYLNGARVSLTGGGTYDATADALDLKISPRSQDISFGDVSASVLITGSLAKPSVRPDVVETGGKVAGLLLSAVNPALGAFAATNLGLGDGEEEQVQDDMCAMIAALPAGNKAVLFQP